jgi:hypothetical protein
MARDLVVTFPIAKVTDCQHPLYGREVLVQAERGTLRLIQPVSGGAQWMVSKIHLEPTGASARPVHTNMARGG